MMQNITLSVVLFLAIISPALAAEEVREEDDKGIFNVVIENDIFAGSDSDYTNGVRFAWLSSEENMPGWIQSVARALPIAGDGNKRLSVAAGQSMFAPEDLSRRDLVSGDQPYAGWLYGSVGMVSDTGKTLDNVVLTLGVVGPASLAEPTQKFVHKLTDSPQPNGWDNQLKNEPGIVLTYERKWRSIYEISPFGLSADVTPHAGVNLGNINTDATVGATFRLGYDLPADYGPPRIRPSLPGSDFFIPTQELGGYLFTTIGQRAVARNIFLDGNTFTDSPSVDKKNFVTSLQVGAAVTYGETRLSYTQVFMTKEYDTQKHPSVFGALTLSHRF
ncbi:MAG: lipid A deacylase LpxR family protein [Alphaproteobacteria bacterium]|nr:lipid A deacylase LpxR family protein [Alphaproteobacteria bacterium]